MVWEISTTNNYDHYFEAWADFVSWQHIHQTHCHVHSMTLRGLTLSVLDLEPYGRSQVSLEQT